MARFLTSSLSLQMKIAFGFQNAAFITLVSYCWAAECDLIKDQLLL
jgi:hypothetical protein